MAPLLHRQPYKTIYLLGFAVVTVFIQLPYWLIYYSWRPNRPRTSWTLRRTIRARLVRKISQLPFKVGIRGRRDLSLEVPQEELEPLNSRFVWVPELQKEDVVGLVAEHADRAGVESIAIPAYWFLKERAEWLPEHDKARKDEKVILYIHGGAFTMGTAHPSYPTAAVPKGMLKYSTSLSRVLSVDYRLSSGPPLERENPFPAAIIDGVAAYKYLVCEVGFQPQNITLGGDSAGGNIALALTRYIVESRLPHLPPPGGFIGSSPSSDMSLSRWGIGSSRLLNSESDIFAPPRHISARIVDAYIGKMDPEETKYNRYLSPSSGLVVPANVGEAAELFSGFPRSYIMGGGAEVLFDDIVALTKRMKDEGVDITTDFPPDAVHAYPIFTWHEPERTESLIKCAAWFDECRDTTVVTDQTSEGEDTLL